MPALTAALIATAAIAAAGTAYQAKSSADAKHDAEDAASEQKGAQEKLINDQRTKEFDKQQSEAVKRSAQLKQSQATGLSGGSQTTTGAGGLQTPPPGKTLLGM